MQYWANYPNAYVAGANYSEAYMRNLPQDFVIPDFRMADRPDLYLAWDGVEVSSTGSTYPHPAHSPGVQVGSAQKAHSPRPEAATPMFPAAPNIHENTRGFQVSSSVNQVYQDGTSGTSSSGAEVGPSPMDSPSGDPQQLRAVWKADVRKDYLPGTKNKDFSVEQPANHAHMTSCMTSPPHNNETPYSSAYFKFGPINRPAPMAHGGHGGHGGSVHTGHPHMYSPPPPAATLHQDVRGMHAAPPGVTVTSSSNNTPVGGVGGNLIVPTPLKMQRPNKTYHCRMCDQEFVNKSNLHQHSKEVHRMQEKMHKCVKCFKSFPSSQQLNQHMLVHNNIRKYRCQYCDKAFKQLSHVQQHQRRHTGERPYKCTIEGCDKAFAQLSNLQQHQRNHDARRQQSDRKPYQCSICDRRFATEVSLNNHISKLHADMYRIPERRCQVCGKQFYTEEKHIRHMNRFHPDLWAEYSGGRPLEFFIPPREVQHREKKFVCTVCSKTYSHETGLLKHLVTHPESQDLRMRLWACCVCDKVFTKESYLERHLEMKLDPEHGKALSEYKKRNGIKEVGRVNLHEVGGGRVNMLPLPATGSALVSSSDAVIAKVQGGGRPEDDQIAAQASSAAAQVMAASSTARCTPDGMQSPPPQLGHPADLSTHAGSSGSGGGGGGGGGGGAGLGPRSPPGIGSPTASCSLAAADSTVPSPFSPPPPPPSHTPLPPPETSTSAQFSQRSPIPTRPLGHSSPLLNRSISEPYLSSPLFNPAMPPIDPISHTLAHGPMNPPPQGVAPLGFRPPPNLGGYNTPTQPYGGHFSPNPGLHSANMHSNLHSTLRFSHHPLTPRRDYMMSPTRGDHDDVLSGLQSLVDSTHPS